MTIHESVSIPVGTEALFSSLSDPARLVIVACLAHGEHRVRDLMDELSLAQATVSEHIACLKNCGLVKGRPEGRQTFYSLACPDILDLLQAAERVLDATGHAVDTCPRYRKTLS